MRKLSIVGLALLTTFALLPSQASHPQSQPNGDVVGFTQVSGNEYWVQIRLSGPDGPTATSVSAMDTGGPWVTLKPQTWTSDRTWWAGSFHIEPGHQVRFSASFPDGVTGFLSCWFDHPTGVERCGTSTSSSSTFSSSSSSSSTSSSSPSTTSSSSSTTSPPGSVLFTQVGGNEYWVQVRLGGSAGPAVTKVRAMDTNGPWVTLSPQTWTSDHTWWAGSFRIEAGNLVRFEATLPGGSIVLSCWFEHRTGTERCGGTPTLTPEGIHLGTLGDLRNSITVTWRVPGDDPTQAVEFGRTTAYGSRAPASGVTPPQSTGKVYTASLSGLAPDTVYHYRVGSSNGWSADETFRTAPADRLAREVRIGVLGDTGINPQAAATYARLDAANLDAVVHVGDHAYANVPADWDRYMVEVQPAGAESPFLAAIGNHEVESCCGLTSFTSRMSLPGNEMWWSTDLGNVHIVVLNSEPTTGDGHFPEDTNVFTTSSPQYQWLEDDLEAAKLTGRYLVVAFHRPIYSSSTVHPSNPGMRSVLEPLFDRMDVDLVLTGHAHNYERSYPLEGGTRTTTDLSTYSRGAGRIHLVTGGGGRPLYDSWQAQPAWSATRASAFEWVELVAGTDGSLRVTARRTNEGTVLDSFTILPSTTTTATSKEAELFAVRTAGGRQTDGAASGGAVWNLWSNGNVQDSLDAGDGGDLAIVARGQPLGGVWPTMVVSVDGAVVRTMSVTSTALTTYSIGPVTAGTHSVRVAFTNDASSSSEDRNLVLDVVRIVG